MALKTREDYIQSLKRMRPNVYKFGVLVQDVTTHPGTRRTVESHARAFDLANDPEHKAIVTTVSNLTGEKIHTWNSVTMTMEDTLLMPKLKRLMFRETGTCVGGTCAGWHGLNAMWAVTYEIDNDLGTNYHERLKNWILYAQSNGLIVAGALTDAKGDRSKKPSQQEDLDMNIHIVEKRDDGIIVRGCKAMICGATASNEIMVFPGSGYGESDKDFAVVFVVPRDVEGLTLIETRRASDERELEEGWDNPVETGITQAYLIFDNVFVPNERVFMCGEYKYAGNVVSYFTANYRASIGACVSGQGDVMVGAGVLMARINGLSEKAFNDKLVQMTINNETSYGVGLGSIISGQPHPSGLWVADHALAHITKVLVTTLPYETKRLCQDIGGGIVETGCFPSYKDFMSPEIGELCYKYVKAASPAETRARMARLVEWLTVGAGIPGCMHGGGSPDGAKMVIRAFTPFEEYVALAKKLAGIKEDIPDPKKKKNKQDK